MWRCVPFLLCACALGAFMGSERARRINGIPGRTPAVQATAKEEERKAADRLRHATAAIEARGVDAVDWSPKANAQRERCKRDPKYFYDTVIAGEVRNKQTGKMEKRTLGRIHDLYLDFMTFEVQDVPDYFGLRAMLPAQDALGQYKERWLYWRTLDMPPEVQEGPDGPISGMFHQDDPDSADKLWYGVIVRIKGDGSVKCNLVPRGHLKSTLGTVTLGLWHIIRDPSDRALVRSITGSLARSFVADVAGHFTNNERFRRLFGDLGPMAKGEGPWNGDFFRVRSKEYRGREPTLWAMGLESEITGNHFDYLINDDLVGESNFRTEAMRKETCNVVERQQPLLDPIDGKQVDTGTRWEFDDCHAMYVAREGEFYEDASFMVATLEDDDKQPLWKERITPAAVQRIKRKIKDARKLNAQYYNQFCGSTSRTFSTGWIRKYEGTAIDAAVQQKLNIFIGIDTASGKKDQTSRNLGWTTGFVQGQNASTGKRYFLDGFKEKLPAERIIFGIVDLCIKWKDIAARYGGQFEVGAEDNVYTTYLAPSLDNEFRRRGVKSIFSVTALTHSNVSKIARITTLAAPYAEGLFLWPEEMIRTPVGKPNDAWPADVIERTKGQVFENYDVVLCLRDEYKQFPAIHGELLDSHAYADQLANPRDWRGEAAAPAGNTARNKDVYDREQAIREQTPNPAADRYRTGGEWQQPWERGRV